MSGLPSDRVPQAGHVLVRGRVTRIEAVNGAVYLMGVAQDQGELDRVVAHAKDLAYVRQVVNYVRLKDDPTRDS